MLIRLYRWRKLSADVWKTGFKVDCASCVVRIDCRSYPATKARDQQVDHLCRIAERVGREFISLQADPVDLLSGQRPAIEDKQ